ncbi:MAG: hypothetical protein IH624_11990, partial [Phycisphaerae bacterium]|nr:hypothetical protein [Phycisphaerae bacterium]
MCGMNARSKRNLIFCVRVCVAGAGLVLLVFGGVCFKAAYEIHGEVEAMSRPLVEMAVDLSQAGTYSAVLGPVERYFHGIGLHIEIETAERDGGQLAKLFEGIGGTATITDGDGEVVCKLAVAAEGLACYATRREAGARAWAMFLERVPQYEAGHSTLTLEIDRPAGGLAGVRQMFVAKYNLCGLESSLSLIAAVVGVVA